jgi:hypothetical protein
VIVFGLWCDEEKVLKTFKKPLHFCQKLIKVIFEKNSTIFANLIP